MCAFAVVGVATNDIIIKKMKQSEIRFSIELDDKDLPEKIFWKASDTDNQLTEAKAIALAIWDSQEKNCLRLDLWTKDMPIDEMKGFSINILGGMADTLMRATNDEYMAQEIHQLCEKLAIYLKDSQQNTEN